MGRKFEHRRETTRRKEEWIARTQLGKSVQNGAVTSLDSLLEKGTKILEPQIIDALLPELREEVLEVTSTQRMTAYGRKQQMRSVVVIGDGNGFVGVGVGKAADSRDSISEGIKDAKKNIIKVQLGCSSWECKCGTPHTILREAHGHNSSTEITLKPAPRGVGIVANQTAKKVLGLAGVKDAWSFTKGRTRNILNMALTTIDALDSINKLKTGKIGE